MRIAVILAALGVLAPAVAGAQDYGDYAPAQDDYYSCQAAGCTDGSAPSYPYPFYNPQSAQSDYRYSYGYADVPYDEGYGGYSYSYSQDYPVYSQDEPVYAYGSSSTYSYSSAYGSSSRSVTVYPGIYSNSWYSGW